MATFQAGTLDDDGVFHPIAGAVGDTEDEARCERPAFVARRLDACNGVPATGPDDEHTACPTRAFVNVDADYPGQARCAACARLCHCQRCHALAVESADYAGHCVECVADAEDDLQDDARSHGWIPPRDAEDLRERMWARLIPSQRKAVA